MMENEELEVLLAYSEGDGWVKARNYKGEEGFVPQNYLDLHIDDQIPSSATNEDIQASVQQQPHPESIVEEEPEQLLEEMEEEETAGLENQISFSSVDYTYQQSCNAGQPDEMDEPFPGPPPPPPPPPQEESAAPAENDGNPPAFVGYCRALYDYDATSDEELTFYEGEVIAILRRRGVHGDGDVDDGWWEGQLLPDGPRGVFPSLVVEECGPNGEELTPKVCLTPTVIQRMRIQLKTNC